MKYSVYTAVRTLSGEHKELNGHITTSFTEMNRKLPKIEFDGDINRRMSFIEDVVYWPEANVTVALVSMNQYLRNAHNYMMEIGLDYPHEFRPHITLSHKDDALMYQYLVGSNVTFGNEYVGFLSKED